MQENPSVGLVPPGAGGGELQGSPRPSSLQRKCWGRGSKE